MGIEEGDGFRATEPVSERRAAFCRLEHVVPWVISGARWEPGRLVAADDDAASGLGRCAHCAAALDEGCILLIRHRGEHRIADAFCDTGHLLAWAKAGGRWQVR